MDTRDNEQVIKSVWRDQAIWSETATQLKNELTTWRIRAALSGVLGAFLETLAASLSGFGVKWWLPRTILAAMGAVALAIVPYVVKAKASNEKIREWVRARSASELLKETIYRYLLKVPPFNAGSSPADLIERSQEIIKNLGDDLNQQAAACFNVKEKPRPLKLTIDEYVEKRVNDQIKNYYEPRCRENAAAAKRLHQWEFRLGLLAIALGAISTLPAITELPIFTNLGAWIAVITTAGAAITTHLSASRYDHQAMIYFGTARRLRKLYDLWPTIRNQPDPTQAIAKFVDDCEHAISTENEAWMAEWLENNTNGKSDESK